MEKIINELTLNEKTINKIVLSDSKTETKKIIVRPIKLKSGEKWQIERYVGAQVFHENVEFPIVLKLNFSDFKQILIEKEGENKVFSASKTGFKAKTNTNNTKREVQGHNKKKNYLINEGDDVPAMVELGIFSKEGKIINSMYDKFKQINKFIEIVDHSFSKTNKKEITVLDFGCGKSYLTFLIYHYFVFIKGIKAKIIGYDIKKDVVAHCNEIAKKYGYDGLVFELSDVKKDSLYSGKIDMVISLHACDTATDYALDFAIKNKVKHIFSVPCCQHEINSSIVAGGDFDLLISDGLFKERFSSLLTDAIRTEVLRSKGYSVDVIEFVDFAHSPKNIMLRAELNSTQKSLKRVLELKEKYGFEQTLLSLQK